MPNRPIPLDKASLVRMLLEQQRNSIAPSPVPARPVTSTSIAPENVPTNPIGAPQAALPATGPMPTPRPDPMATASTGGGGATDYFPPAPGSEPRRAGLFSSFFGGDANQQGGWGGNDPDDSFRSRLNKLGAIMMMLDPMSRTAGTALLQMQQNRSALKREDARTNDTMQWLKGQGLGEQESKFVASNPDALKTYYDSWIAGKSPKWELKELLDADGNKQNYMVDMKTGNISPIGGHSKDTDYVAETIYQNGKAQRVLVDRKHPQNPVIPLGEGQDDKLYSPEAQQQAIDRNKASAPPVGENAQDKTMGEFYGKRYSTLIDNMNAADANKNTLDTMARMVDQPGFVSGDEGWTMRVKRLGKNLGITDADGLEAMEVFDSLARQNVKASLGSLGPGVSAGDLIFMERLQAGMGTSRGGNKALIEMGKILQERNKAIGQEAIKYANAHNGRLDSGFDSYLLQYNQQHPIFSEEDKARIDELAKDTTMPGAPKAAGQAEGAPGTASANAVPADTAPVSEKTPPPVAAAPAVVAPPVVEQPEVPPVFVPSLDWEEDPDLPGVKVRRSGPAAKSGRPKGPASAKDNAQNLKSSRVVPSVSGFNSGRF